METTEQLALRVAQKLTPSEVEQMRIVRAVKECLSELEKQQEPYGYLMRHYEEGPPVFMRHPLPAGHSPLMAVETLYTHPAIPQPAAVPDGRNIDPMPPTEDRRPDNDDRPDGYLESDRSWESNNPGAITWFIDNHRAIRAMLSAAPVPPSQEAKDAERLISAIKNLRRAYVNMLENGRDRIVSLGGQCDPVDVMEMNDPHLRDADAAMAANKEAK